MIDETVAIDWAEYISLLGIKRRVETTYDKTEDPELKKLLRYFIEGATFGQTKRAYRPMVRNLFKGEGK